MAKRLTDTDLWDKEWYMKLSPKLKCLTKFVWDKCDLSGVWHPNWTLANMYVGDFVIEKELLDIDNGKQFIKIGDKIYCPDFIRFQNGDLKTESEISLNNKKISPIHKKIWDLLKHHNIPYPYPIDRTIVVVEVIVEDKVIVNVDRAKEIFENLVKQENWLSTACKGLALPYSTEALNHTWLVDRLREFLNIQASVQALQKSEVEIKKHFMNWARIKRDTDPEIIKFKNVNSK